jgi:KaiC/GvpD/RAD55 family RecA-like ATPase
MGTSFVSEGMKCGERAVIAVFEENPASCHERARQMDFELEEMVERGDLRCRGSSAGHPRRVATSGAPSSPE